jgi:hypothetical protein
MSDFLL